MAVKQFDAAYTRARMTIYYKKGIPHVPEVTLNMNCLLHSIEHAVEVVLAFCELHINANANANANDSAESSDLSSFIKSQWINSWVGSLFVVTPESIILASSMTIGAVYGLKSGRSQPFIASFTISCLLGGVTAMKVAISLCRVSGTAIACLYTLILASFAPSGRAEQAIFGAAAVVVFLFPCTYLRSNPIVGYS
jgi:hypothetical protein